MDAIAALGALNTVSNVINNNDDNEKQQKYTLDLMKQQNKYNKEAAAQNQQYAKEMFDYTGPVNKIKQLKEAGLNPGLVYGMGSNSSGSTAGAADIAATGLGSAPNVSANKANRIAQTGMILQLAKLSSEIDVNKSVAESNRANAALNVEKTNTEPFNRFKTMVEEELIRYQANNEMRTQEAKVEMAFQLLKNEIAKNQQIEQDSNLKYTQIQEIVQRIEQTAVKFNYDITKTQAEIDKIVKETTNQDITVSQQKLIDVLRGLLPMLIIK